jgi:hypothetical protein
MPQEYWIRLCIKLTKQILTKVNEVKYTISEVLGTRNEHEGLY